MRSALTVGLVFALAATTFAADEAYVRDFESGGQVYVEGYFDGTDVTIYSATREALQEVQSFRLDAGEKKTLQLPEGARARC